MRSIRACHEGAGQRPKTFHRLYRERSDTENPFRVGAASATSDFERCQITAQLRRNGLQLVESLCAAAIHWDRSNREIIRWNRAPKCGVAVCPFGELGFDSRAHRCDIREILVVSAKLSSELPHSFYGVEIGAVWWEVIKTKVRFVFLTPSAV